MWLVLKAQGAESKKFAESKQENFPQSTEKFGNGFRSNEFRYDGRCDRFELKREQICGDNLGMDRGGDRCGNRVAGFNDLVVGGDLLGFLSGGFCLRAVFDPDEFFLPGGLPGSGGGDEGGVDV